MLTSFKSLVFDGLRLDPQHKRGDPPRTEGDGWPYRYADLRRGHDLHNALMAAFTPGITSRSSTLPRPVFR